MTVITIDARLLNFSHWSGVEHYSFNVVSEMCALAPNTRFRLLFDSEPGDPRLLALTGKPNVSARTYKGSARFYGALAFDLLLSRSNVYYAMGGRLPPYKLPCRAALVIHDLLPLTRPEYLDEETARSLARKWRQAVPKADLIVTVSAATRVEISRCFSYPDHRIHVAPPAVVERPEGTRPAWLPQGRFVLMVNPGRANKNWCNGLLGFKGFVEAGPYQDVTLVLVGALGSEGDAIRELVASSGLARSVVLAGYATDGELGYVYRHATAALFPSWYEGFGMPALEALHYGVPLVASDIASIRELAGDAAVLVDPADAGAIAAGLARVIGEPATRDAYVKAGLARAASFSWRETAAKTLKALSP
jgi:glycosyltransferase involved in cell wall biosynthesis